ncbi:MAG: hypothetical protein ACRD8O_24625 [Bryobacteraceae bacterium]
MFKKAGGPGSPAGRAGMVGVDIAVAHVLASAVIVSKPRFINRAASARVSKLETTIPNGILII